MTDLHRHRLTREPSGDKMPGLWRKRTRKPFTPVEQVRGSTHGSKQSTRGAVDPTEVLDNAGGRRAEWLRTAQISGRSTTQTLTGWTAACIFQPSILRRANPIAPFSTKPPPREL